MMFYSIFFFFNNKATIKDTITANNTMMTKALLSSPIGPRETFIPKNEDIMVGTDKTIVAAAKNFIAIFRLFEIIVA